MNEPGLDFEIEQEEYGRMTMRLVNGVTITGTIKSTHRMSDEMNTEERFVALSDAEYKTGKKTAKIKIIFVNKEHVLWAVPND